LFRRWLLTESPWAAALEPLSPFDRDDAAAHGGLPNRFVAIVPSKWAEHVAEACGDAARDWWLSRASKAATELEEQAPGLAGFAGMATEQAGSLLQITWAASAWPAVDRCEPGTPELARVAWARGGHLPGTLKGFIDLARRPAEPGRDRPFHPNGGALYGAAYDGAQVLLDAVKRTRPPSAREEGGLKCSLCGVRSVVAGRDRFEDQKAAWSEARHDAREGDLRRGEALCGVCWTKRRFGRREDFQAPSTAEIAASPFKRAVLDRVGELRGEVEALCDAVETARWPRAWVVPGLARVTHDQGPAGRFARVDGELLLGTPRGGGGPDDQSVPAELRRAVAGLRRAARDRGIAPPRPYLAVLAMDGDEMGKWLSGEKNAALREYLSTAAQVDLAGQDGNEHLDRRWPATPAFHATLSEACATFSQSTAPRTVERDGLLGTLVYAGGDDLLALLPIGCPDGEGWEVATEAARRLRLRYSGCVRREGKGDEPDPNSTAGFVLDGGPRLAFGHGMTASGAIVVFHQRTPLQRALAEAHRALEHAKEDLGRDALAISILRRSGQITRTGLGFDGIPALQQVARAFTAGLSPRFLGEITRRLAPLAGGLPGDELVDLAKPIVKQALTDHFEGEPQAKAEASAAVEDLATSARGGRDGSAASRAARCPADRRRLDRWLGLVECAAFLAREVEP
jgi:CRISPR-associated protein Cmr2